MEIRGTIGIADFQGTVIRQVGKDMFSERVALRRKLAETDVRIGMLSEGVSPRAPAPFLPDQAIVVETSPLHSKPTNRIPIYVRLKLISAGLVLAVVGMARNSLVHKDAPSECLHCSIDT